MKSPYSIVSRSVLALAVAATLGAAVPAFSQPPGENPGTYDHAARHRQHMQTRLNQMAQQLEIKDGQKAAWAEYTRAVESMLGAKPAPPPAEADAAAIVRQRAQRMTEHAQKLNQLADATARLQEALDAEQRQKLTEIVRQRGMRGEHHKHHSGSHGPS
jgi:hypothetical protein